MEIQEMDVEEQPLRSGKTGRRNKTRRHYNRRKGRIDEFMENKTTKRRELIDKIRNRTDKMDVVNQYKFSKMRSRTQKKRSAVDRIKGFFTP
jgi:hypothetical protein